MLFRSSSGFTLVEIMIVVAIIGLLAMIAIPNYVSARATAQEEGCVKNLSNIFTAKELFALENNISAIVVPTPAQLDPYIKGGTARCLCPADRNQTLATSYDIQHCGGNPFCLINPVDHVLD